MTSERNRLDPEDAARVAGLTVAQLLELCSDGHIPGAVLDGKGWHFTRKGLEVFTVRRKGRQDDAA